MQCPKAVPKASYALLPEISYETSWSEAVAQVDRIQLTTYVVCTSSFLIDFFFVGAKERDGYHRVLISVDYICVGSVTNV